MSRWTSLMLKATIFVLVLAILGTAGALARYALLNDGQQAPRTEAERALYLAVQSVKANPNDPQARIKLAATYLELGKITNAVKEAKVATRLAPDNGQALYVLGLTQEEKGDLKQAVANFEKAAKSENQLGPFYQTCWLEAAKVYMEMKDYKKAIKAYNSALGYGPESAPILYSLGEAYEKSGDKASALAYYKEALEFIPDYEEAIAASERLIKAGVTLKGAPADNKTEGAQSPASTDQKATK